MKESISFFCFSNKSRLFHMADIKKSLGNNRTNGQDFFLTKTDEGEKEK